MTATPAPVSSSGPSSMSPAAAASLHEILSLLSFSSEHPIHSHKEGQSGANVFVDGLFCLGFHEDADLFFDAVQDLDAVETRKPSSTPFGNHDVNATSSQTHTHTALSVLRGGEQTHPSDEASFVPVSNQRRRHHQQPTAPPTSSHYQGNQHSLSHRHWDRQHASAQDEPFSPLPPPPPPQQLPLRFLRAGKDDPIEGQRRYEATLQWRRELGMDTILTEPHPHFDLIKANYPHYYHLTGRNGEPVFFELPPKTNLPAMRKGGITLPELLRHYAMVTEFQWQFLERDDLARSITVLDLEGMRMRDFVGECVEYVRQCSQFTGQHYPERAGFVFVINVPAWFALIWKVVQPMVDEVTLRKISIVRGREAIYQALLDKIPPEHIPPEYGGQSMPLGASPQEDLLRDLMHHNLRRAQGDCSCGGRGAQCPFCSFVPARSY